MAEPFVHLHVHSHYSLLDGAAKIPELVQTAIDYKMPALALTDHGNLFGAFEFYELAKKKGIKPIIGYEAYVAYPSRLFRGKEVKEVYGNEEEQTTKKTKKIRNHITLLAKNYEGYRNLMKLASEAYATGFYYKPQIDEELLFQHREGLIVLSGCLNSRVCQTIMSGKIKEAEEIVAMYKDVFPSDYYIEIQYNGLEEQNQVNTELVRISQKFDLPMVFTNDIHYIHPEDAGPHDVLLCIQTGKKVNDKDRFRFSSQEFYMKSSEKMYEESKYFPNAAINTAILAEKVNIVLPSGDYHLPKYECPNKKSNEEYLLELCERGLVERYGSVDDSLRQRFEHEFKTICKMGFASYFLIVWDFINYARSKGISVGPGRGSAAGSIVSYTLHITNLDPIRYNLIFERFLNDGRKEMPDIDIDFETNRRSEVIDYVTQKYGKEQVCQIITFGTMAARGVIRDVGRVLDIPLAEVDPIAKKVPATLKITLEKALEENEEFRKEYENNPTAKKIIDIGKRLEGLARQPGTHAAGVIIADKDIREYCPLYYTKEDGKETVSTQYSMEHIGSLGLLKMDFLGLNTLTLLEKALEMIKVSRGVTIDLDKIPMDDQKSYNMLCRGDTNGVFQLESDGMQKLVEKLKPDRFEDIIALVALYRPGPLGSGMVDTYCDCKHGHQKVEYKHPLLESILSETYGVILYQEQVMQIASIMAGFSLTEADKLRKAMGKKRKDIMEEYRKKFVDGTTKKQIDTNIANEIFDLMDYFSGYGFNKSHSAAYALVSYQTAYLKANYRKEYMAALLTIESQDLDKISKYIHECMERGLPILPPDINESQSSFWPTKDGIRFGFSGIKGFGEKAIESFLETRKKTGKFDSLFDLCEKTAEANALDKRALEALTKSGSLDCFGKPREQIFASIGDILQQMQSVRKQKKKNQTGFDFSPTEDEVATISLADVGYAKEYQTWTEKQRLDYEKEALGFVFAHPAKRWLPYLQMLATHKIADLAKLPHHTSVTIACTIATVRETVVKKEGKNKGKKMAQLTFDDFVTSAAGVCFPDTYEKYSSVLQADELVFVHAKVDSQGGNGEPQILVEHITKFEDAITKLSGKIILELNAPTEDQLTQARALFPYHKGVCPTYLRIQENEKTTLIRVNDEYRLQPCAKLLDTFEKNFGRKAIRLVSKNT